MSNLTNRSDSGSGRRFFYSGGVLVSEWVGDQSSRERTAWSNSRSRMQRNSTKKIGDSLFDSRSVSTKSSNGFRQTESISTMADSEISPSGSPMSIQVIDLEESSSPMISPAHILPRCECSIPTDASYTERVLAEFACQYEHAATIDAWEKITDLFQEMVQHSPDFDMELNPEMTERLIEARQSSLAKLAAQKQAEQPHPLAVLRRHEGTRNLESVEEESEEESGDSRSFHQSFTFGNLEGLESEEDSMSDSDSLPSSIPSSVESELRSEDSTAASDSGVRKSSPAQQKKLSLLQARGRPSKPVLVSIESGMKVDAQVRESFESPRESLLYAMGRVDAALIAIYEAQQK